MPVIEENITIKGVADGLVISFANTEWKDMQIDLFKKIDENLKFFENARLALEVGDTKIKAAEMGKLRELIMAKEISLWAILSTCDVTLNSAQMLGIATQLGLKKTTSARHPYPSFDGDAAVWIEKTLRAGYHIETKSHVIVIGDVNPGAEIISGGNIFIWGRANGAFHAGAEGNQSAKIYALDLKPTSLKIANIAAVPITGKIKNQSEFACIEEGQIAIKSWTSRRSN